jgi:hypothetical protein
MVVLLMLLVCTEGTTGADFANPTRQVLSYTSKELIAVKRLLRVSASLGLMVFFNAEAPRYAEDAEKKVEFGNAVFSASSACLRVLCG